jgi:hypothetical protein
LEGSGEPQGVGTGIWTFKSAELFSSMEPDEC